MYAIWKFKESTEQPAEDFDRAETYLYDISTGPWGSEASWKWLLRCAVNTATQIVIAALGFPGMGTAFATKYTFTAHYTKVDEILVQPEWLHKMMTVKRISLYVWTPE